MDNPLQTFDLNIIKNLHEKAARDIIIKQANHIINIISDSIRSNPSKYYTLFYDTIYKENLTFLEQNNINILTCSINPTISSFYMISWNKDIEQSILQYQKYYPDHKLQYEKYS
jgi:hypothetical protein